MGILKDLYNLTQPDLKVSGLAAPPAAPAGRRCGASRHGPGAERAADGEGFRERTEETEAHTEQVVFAG